MSIFQFLRLLNNFNGILYKLWFFRVRQWIVNV